MKKILIIVIILFVMFMAARSIRNNKCLNMPLSEAFKDTYCKKYWSKLYG